MKGDLGKGYDRVFPERSVGYDSYEGRGRYRGIMELSFADMSKVMIRLSGTGPKSKTCLLRHGRSLQENGEPPWRT